MSLEKVIEVDLVEIVNHNVVQIRTATKIMEDGKQLSVSLSRHTISPGEDYSGECDKVKAICAALHTPQGIAEYQAYIAERQAMVDAERVADIPVAPTPSA